jgi:hypothetical protein
MLNPDLKMISLHIGCIILMTIFITANVVAGYLKDVAAKYTYDNIENYDTAF